MPRIQLQFPEKVLFKTEIPIRITDINYGGHVGNDAILSMIQEVRMQFFGSMGYTELDLAGSGTIMADTAIVYKTESFYGDTLLAEVAIDDVTRVSFDLFYRLSSKSHQKEVAIAKTGIVCFDYSLRKVVQVPKAFLQKIGLS